MVVDLLRNLGYNDVQINRIINDVSLIKRTDEKLKNSIINVYDFLKDMGYSSEEIISITTLSPTLFNNSGWVSNVIFKLVIPMLMSLFFNLFNSS